MLIESFRIANYKSISDSESVTLSPGFNVIVGANNAGKTAVLEALSLQYDGNPHRSIATLPHVGTDPDPNSTVDMVVNTEAEHVSDVISDATNFVVLMPQYPSGFAQRIQYVNDGADSIGRFTEWLGGLTNIRASFRRSRSITSEAWAGTEPHVGSEHYPARQGAQTFLFGVQTGHLECRGFANQSEPSIASSIGKAVAGRIYRFRAERFNVGSSGFGPSSRLRGDAGNLPEVLNYLQGANPARFATFNGLVREILPGVQAITVRPLGTNRLEVLVWPIDPATERADLALTLDQCGTGIGQVLAILYVVLNSDVSQVILLDEPQSFLHPGAARKLIEVLKRHPRHQYIVATHSPEIISAIGPTELLSLSWRDGRTSFTVLDASSSKVLQGGLAELGARLSDVFGADRVLWVEGISEEIAFPKMLRSLRGRSLMGTAVIGVRNTADFEGDTAQRTVQIYQSLSTSQMLIPPAVGFLFDRETRSEQAMQDIYRASKGRARFLSRRMFENYLLDVPSIVQLMNSIEGFRSVPVTDVEIEGPIKELRGEKSFFKPLDVDVTGQWIANIHAARLLTELFRRLSETRVEFDKVKHSTALAEIVAERNPESLNELMDTIEGAVRD